MYNVTLSNATENRLQQGLAELQARHAVREAIHLDYIKAKAQVYDRWKRFDQWSGICYRDQRDGRAVRYLRPGDFRALLNRKRYS
jgi:hypothetical protein